MNANERRLLRILLERTEPVTAAALADALGVSERTVRSYVRSINDQAAVPCVESGRRGYWYRCDAARALLAREDASCDDRLPQTNGERCVHVINRVLRSPQPLATADLAEELCVSTSTMGAVLARARRHLARFDLVLRQEDGRLLVDGTEKNKRRLLGELLYDEAASSFLDVTTVQRAFPGIDAERIRSIVVAALERHRFFVNGYSLVNIVLHIAIAVDRIRNGGASAMECPDAAAGAFLRAHDFEIADEIADELGDTFEVDFSRAEREELALLISSRTTLVDCDGQSDEDLARVVGPECLALVEQLIGGIEAYYFINLSDREFYVRFALHVRNLLARAGQRSFARNPLTEEIRTTCPLLYDSGVYCAGVIEAETGIEINDDEIAYLSFHLGSTLEAQRQLAAKVRCALFCPSYYDIGERLRAFLERDFPDDLIIVDVATTSEELARLTDAELVIAAAPLREAPAVPMCRVGIVPRDSDVGRVRAIVSRIQLEKRRARFRAQLEQLVAPGLFGVTGAAATREEAIPLLASALERGGYVGPGYEDEIWERERLSATAFGAVAVPHALKPHAERSGIAVLVPERPIDWGGARVGLVLMLAFTLHERSMLNELFDPLVAVLSEPRHVAALVAERDREAFIERLSSLVE